MLKVYLMQTPLTFLPPSGAALAEATELCSESALEPEHRCNYGDVSIMSAFKSFQNDTGWDHVFIGE
jgi:hypothetical protein